jgi:putative endopeptidase
MPVTAINEMMPAFDWNAFMSSLGVKGIASINIGQPEYFKAVNAALTTIPIDDWKSYLAWRLAARTSPYLSSAFVNEDFSFSSLLNGARQMQPRWRRCLSVADNVLGDALGKEYVKVAFTPEAKAQALEMIENLRAVMRERITKADWMSDATKQQALVKLTSLNRKIGYPDVWRDYSDLKVVEGPWAANYLNARSYAVRRDLGKLGHPVDRNEWFMTPPTVNAYFAPNLNEIAFPAGRLQPPFFRHTTSAQTTAESAEPSGTRCHTASTTRAGSMTRRAISSTGGRPRMQRTTPSAPKSWRISTVPTLSSTPCM